MQSTKAFHTTHQIPNKAQFHKGHGLPPPFLSSYTLEATAYGLLHVIRCNKVTSYHNRINSSIQVGLPNACFRDSGTPMTVAFTPHSIASFHYVYPCHLCVKHPQTHQFHCFSIIPFIENYSSVFLSLCFLFYPLHCFTYLGLLIYLNKEMTFPLIKWFW